MSGPPQTVRDELSPGLRRGVQTPGVVILFSGHRAVLKALRLAAEPLELGRERLTALGLEDEHTSRRHLRLSCSGHQLVIEDLASTNGVFVNGARLAGSTRVHLEERPVVRLGRTVLMGVADVAVFEGLGASLLTLDGQVIGPALARVRSQVSALARHERTLFIHGERGAGKARLARLFHRDADARAGAFMRYDEQLFEGDAFREPRATLFLDEADTLTPQLQGKLLRALELPGVETCVVAAARHELRDAVTAGRVTLDFYERVGRPAIHLPPLRERKEEVPFLITAALAPLGLVPAAALVELCMLRPWEGNVRELLREVRSAAALARADGVSTVDLVHLDPRAGSHLTFAQATPGAVDESILQATAAQLGLARKTALKLLPAALFTKGTPDLAPEALRARAADALLSLLEQHEFRQAAVAQALDLSRTTLLKLMERLGLPRASALPLADIEAALAQHGQDVASTARALRVSAEALRQRLALLRQ